MPDPSDFKYSKTHEWAHIEGTRRQSESPTMRRKNSEMSP